MIENNDDTVKAASTLDAAATTAKEQGGRRKTVVLSALAFCVSYVITAGPAVFIVKSVDIPSVTAIAEVLYAPIIFIVKQRIPVLGPLIKAYIDLFQ